MGLFDDNATQTATNAAQNPMELPIGSIPGMGGMTLTPQSQVTMPPIPKPNLQEPMGQYQNPTGKPLSRGGEQRANKYNAVASAVNAVGKFSNRQKEEKYQAIQFDMQRLMEAAQIANDPSVPPQIRQQNEALVQAIMRGKNGKEITKIFGDTNPFGESKDPQGQTAMRNAAQAVQKKTGAMQAIKTLLGKVTGQDGGQSSGQPQMQAPQGIPQRPPMQGQPQGSNNIPPGVGPIMPQQAPMGIPGAPTTPPINMNGAPISGGAATTIGGPQNPSQGNSQPQAIAPASRPSGVPNNGGSNGNVQTPLSAQIMNHFPTTMGLSRQDQAKMQYMKEFQPIIKEYMEQQLEVYKAKSAVDLAQMKLENAHQVALWNHDKALDVAQYNHELRMAEEEFKYKREMSVVHAREKLVSAWKEPIQKMQILSGMKTSLNTMNGEYETKIKELQNQLLITGDKAQKENLNTQIKDITTKQAKVQDDLKRIIQSQDKIASTVDPELVGVGSDIDGILGGSASKFLTDNPTANKVYNPNAEETGDSQLYEGDDRGNPSNPI